jgi:DNA-binding beta-propeller fold protein YncE
MARKFFILSFVLATFVGLLCTSQAAPTSTLAPQPPIALPRAPGFFDYMQVDDQYRRLLVAHSDSRTLDIIDLKSDTLARQVEVGEGHGIAVDVKDGRYYVGTSRPQFIVDVQRKYMVKQNQVPMAGPIDAIALDTKSDMLYADRADNGQIVVMDARRQIVASITVGGSLEYIVYDPVSDRIYQNVTSTGRVAVIDPNTNSIVASWAAAPAGQLRGLAVDGTTHRIFSAGGNGKLVVIDTTTGAVVDAVDIAPGVDQIAFDASTKRLYCASGTGELSVVAETDTGAESLGDVTVPRHAHTVAVDPTTHNVWISYGAPDNDYVMKLLPVTPSPSPSPSTSM